jgi:hypothetical protein
MASILINQPIVSEKKLSVFAPNFQMPRTTASPALALPSTSFLFQTDLTPFIMHTITTSDSPPRRFLRSILLPLFALFVGLGASPQVLAQTFSGGNIFIDNTTGFTNTTFGAGSGVSPSFAGANLGTFDVNTPGDLILNGGQLTFSGATANAAALEFRIFSLSSNQFVTSVQSIPLTQTATNTFSTSNALRSLITLVQSQQAGTFEVDVEFVVTSGRNTFRDITRTASFTTTGVPFTTATWEGDINDDWFNPGNWNTNRVPDMNTNVIVPDFGTASGRQYPNINAGVIFTSAGAAGVPSTTVNNTNSGDAMCRDLDLQGTSIANRSILRLIRGRFKVFGNFFNLQNSFIQRAGDTVIEFASSGQQTISNGEFNEVELSGGGTKILVGRMAIVVRIEFLLNAGLLVTDITRATSEFVELGNRSQDAPDGAQLLGERDDTAVPSFIKGYVFTRRSGVQSNETRINPITLLPEPDPRTFGNIGMSLLFTGPNSPGDVEVTRNTAESYTPLSTITGAPAAFGIRRIFGVRPSNPATNSGGLQATMVFRYLDSETRNLGPNMNGSINEADLALFVSTTSGNEFGNLGRDNVNTVTNELTKTGVRTFATFTLGDNNRPLPVNLTGFDAKRVGADAVVTWETATELNNRGFEVQVSTDGREFRTLGTIAAKSPNSVMPQSYRFVDAEANKAGTRYYRLRQIDLDGKTTEFAPRAVRFDGKASAEPKLAAYPSPFTNELNLDVYSTVAGEGKVTLLDITGRTMSKQSVDLTVGTNQVRLGKVESLKPGIYVVRMVLPSGIVQSTKVVKQ